MPAVPAALARDEDARPDALHGLRVPDTSPETLYDDTLLLASQMGGTPIGLISLVDSERQWFKAGGSSAANTACSIATATGSGGRAARSSPSAMRPVQHCESWPATFPGVDAHGKVNGFDAITVDECTAVTARADAALLEAGRQGRKRFALA